MMVLVQFWDHLITDTFCQITIEKWSQICIRTIRNVFFLDILFFGLFPIVIPIVNLIANLDHEGHNAFDRASCRATMGPLFEQVAWLGGYDLRQSTHLKLIPSCPASRVIGLGNSGLSAPDYFCPAIIGENLEATDARCLWMECSISYIFFQLRLIHSRSINIRKGRGLST